MFIGVSVYNHGSAAGLVDKNGEIIDYCKEESLSRIKGDKSFPRRSIRKSSNFISFVDDLRSNNKVRPGIYERKQLTVNLEANVENKTLKAVLEHRQNLDFAEYEKLKNYAIQSTLRNLSSTANFNLDNKYIYIYVYAPNYFSSLSEEQLTWQNYE